MESHFGTTDLMVRIIRQTLVSLNQLRQSVDFQTNATYHFVFTPLQVTDENSMETADVKEQTTTDSARVMIPVHRELALMVPYVKFIDEPRGMIGTKNAIVIDARNYICGELMTDKHVRAFVDILYTGTSVQLSASSPVVDNLVMLEIAFQFNMLCLIEHFLRGLRLAYTSPNPNDDGMICFVYKVYTRYLNDLMEVFPSLGLVPCVDLRQTMNLQRENLIEHSANRILADYHRHHPGANHPSQFEFAAVLPYDLLVDTLLARTFSTRLFSPLYMAQEHSVGVGGNFSTKSYTAYAVSCNSVLEQWIIEFLTVIGEYTDVAMVMRMLVNRVLCYRAESPGFSRVKGLRTYPEPNRIDHLRCARILVIVTSQVIDRLPVTQTLFPCINVTGVSHSHYFKCIDVTCKSIFSMCSVGEEVIGRRCPINTYNKLEKFKVEETGTGKFVSIPFGRDEFSDDGTQMIYLEITIDC